MALSTRLEIKQSQQLKLTPQLMQSIKLLQLSALELNEFVEQQLLDNPLLERKEASQKNEMEPETESAQLDPGLKFDDKMDRAKTIAQNFDAEIQDIYPDHIPAYQAQQTRFENATDLASAYTSKITDRTGSGQDVDFTQFTQAPHTLSDHLDAQMRLNLQNPKDHFIGAYVVGSVDAQGYLDLDMDLAQQQLNVDQNRLDAVIVQLQRAEPVGLFARNLEECLALQLKVKDRFDPAMAALVGHLDLLASHDHARLRKICGVDQEDLYAMIAELRELDPKPGLQFDSDPVLTLIPDILVSALPNGDFRITLNPEALPKILVNQSYYQHVRHKVSDDEKRFLSQCLQSANWLTKSLDQRAQTMLKVGAKIVSYQSGFFQKGLEHLVPLTLKTIADDIEMHESTVSRVTSNKFISTPRGTFELKYFFSASIGSTCDGEDHAARTVRHLIKNMVDAEPYNKILSDDHIAANLQIKNNINIARRTVTKYREIMNIPSSVVRRREKKQRHFELLERSS